MAVATMKVVMDFFGKKEGSSLKGFTDEWKALTDNDKAQIKAGLEDGTLTY